MVDILRQDGPTYEYPAIVARLRQGSVKASDADYAFDGKAHVEKSTRRVEGAAMVVWWWIAAVAPAIQLPWPAAVALAICLAVEFSQPLHWPALDALRSTTAGHLVLGSGFDQRDLVSYAAGVLAAVLLDRGAQGRRGSANA